MSESILQAHLDLCEEMHALMIEENKLLQSQELDFSHDFLERKKSMISRLEKSVKGLRSINEQGPVEGIRRKELVKAAQKRMMKVFLLERENEQLMLKRDFEIKSSLKSSQPSRSSALSAYAEQAKKEKS